MTWGNSIWLWKQKFTGLKQGYLKKLFKKKIFLNKPKKMSNVNTVPVPNQCK